MEIAEVEIHEFRYRVEDVGPRPDGEMVYVPGSVIEPPGYVLGIRTADGTEGHYRAHMWAPVGAAQIEAVDGDGRVPVPDGPGLGVEIDWDFVDERRTGHALIDGSDAARGFP